ncbi:MAG: cupin domain-containing protein [Candidatus Microthrix sp.]|uniref:cupin domain-containing protein n=1 Tax=Candidatus Neomicrothrix sp. TaxID=2719034 RepID=UPI001B6974A7|nr:cupin domain-containing protein [Candidatus Microthrix sp.]MBP7996453.1 cupin domain-containing protein [Candidatus Microthrix sp.]
MDRPIELATPPEGNFEGYLHGSSVSVVFERIDSADVGLRLHRHPYDETFVVSAGAARFIVGHDELAVHAGQILVAPALVPHRFVTLGEYAAYHIHANDRLVTEWLE